MRVLCAFFATVALLWSFSAIAENPGYDEAAATLAGEKQKATFCVGRFKRDFDGNWAWHDRISQTYSDGKAEADRAVAYLSARVAQGKPAEEDRNLHAYLTRTILSRNTLCALVAANAERQGAKGVGLVLTAIGTLASAIGAADIVLQWLGYWADEQKLDEASIQTLVDTFREQRWPPFDAIPAAD